MRLLLVAVAIPRRSLNSPMTVSRGTLARSAAALVALLLAAARPASTCCSGATNDLNLAGVSSMNSRRARVW